MASKKKGKEAAVVRVAGLRYWRAGDARVVVEAWRRSGEGRAVFARRHGIEPKRLSRWAARLDGPEKAVRFHPVRLVQADAEGGGKPMEIVLVTGHTVRVPAGFAAEDLKRVLGVLSAGAPC